MQRILTYWRIYSIFRRVSAIIFFTLLGLFLIAFTLLQIPSVQSWVGRKTTAWLSDKLKTEVTVDKVNIDIFDHLILEKLYIADQQKDTLLYAGKFEVNIGTLNPFTKFVKIKNITLEDASIHLSKTLPDSTFNFNFITKAFSAADTNATVTPKSGGGKSYQIQLNRITLLNTKFSIHNEVATSDKLFDIGKSEILINKIDLNEHVLALEKIEIDNTTFSVRGLYDTIPSDHQPSWDTIHIAMGDWDLEATQLTIKDCAFNYFNENSISHPSGINFNDLAIKDVNMDISDIFYQGDTIRTTFNRISLKDKSGFELDTLSANVLFSPYEITLTNMVIATPNSSIKNAFGFTFTTLNDFDRLYSDVHMHADLQHSVVAANDLSYFSSALKTYNVNLIVTGNIYGSIDNLKARNFTTVIGDAGSIKGEVNIKGLPNMDETFVDVQFDPLSVNTYALDKISDAYHIPQKVLSLGTINYKGRVTGFVYDLVAFGDLQTDQGGLYSDVNFKYDPVTKTSAYKGTVSTTELNIGILSGEPNMLGKVSMSATIDGKVLPDNTSEFKLEADVNAIEFNHYNYSNIQIDGELKNNFFQGNFAIDDPNIVMAFNGIIDFADTLPVYNFNTKINRANLQNLHFYDKPLVLSATASLNTSGQTINDMTGTARFGDLYLIQERNIYLLDTLVVTSTYANGKKSIKANSTLINFDVTGNYTITELPAAINNMIKHYTNGDVNTQLANQSADFTITVKNADRLTAIFYPSIQTVRDLSITGNFNTATNALNTRIRISEFNYSSITLDTLVFEARTANDQLEFFSKVNSSYLNHKTKIPVLRLEGGFANNQLHYNVKLGTDVAPDRINLNGEVAFIDSLIAFNILPSEIYFRGEKWNIVPNNSLQYSNNNIIAHDFTLTSSEKLISLTSVPDPKYTTVLKLNIKNIPIGELAQTYVLHGEKVSGTLDASFTIGDVIKDPSFLGGAEIRSLTLNDKLLGNLKVNASLIKPSNHLKYNAFLSGDNGFTADGFYIFSEQDSITMDATFNKTKLEMVEPFLRGILSDMHGDISGKLQVNGPANRPEMEGNLAVKKGSMKIDYMGVHYFFDEVKIDLTKNKIVLNPTTIKDKFNNTGALSGEITYSNFSKWNFKSLHLVTDNMLLMDTKCEDNPDFYGYVIGAADVDITGKLDAMLITVNATPHSNSQVILPTYGSGNVKKHDFIRFVNKQDTIKIPQKDELNLSIVDVDLVLNATPDAEIKLLINSEGTEYLTGKGYGSLNIKANSLGKVDMLGDYTISEGLYDFSFQGLFQRPFTVVPGGTISFDGNPYKAKLNLTAEYTAKDVLINSLVESAANEKTDVNVLIKVSGILEAPQIDFDIDIPKTSASTNADFQRRIQQIQADKNELNKQVFGLLITNSFLPQDLTTFNAVGTTANSTLNDFVSSQLTTYFQNVLNDFLKDTEIDIGYDNIKSGTYSYNTDQGKQFKLDVQREINSSLIIKVGTTYYDFTGGSSGSASNIAGDFEVDYLITPDGRVRVKAFRVSEYDAIIAKNDVKTGVGIYYTKDFDKFSDLFKKKKKPEPVMVPQ